MVEMLTRQQAGTVVAILFKHHRITNMPEQVAATVQVCVMDDAQKSRKKSKLLKVHWSMQAVVVAQ